MCHDCKIIRGSDSPIDQSANDEMRKKNVFERIKAKLTAREKRHRLVKSSL